MKNNYNNILFLSLLKKYRKYFDKLNKKIKNGTFSQMAAHERHSLMRKVEQLRSKLEGFQLNTLKYAAAAAFAMTVGSASAQGPFFRNDAENPFMPKIGSTSVVTFNGGDYELAAFVDLDNDGDLDMVGGNYDDFRYFKNIGTASTPNFQEQTGTFNPLYGQNVNGYASPTMGDFDNDGDYDMVTGQDGGALRYFRNTGTSTAPAFTEVTGTFSPLYGFNLGDELVPFAVDIDNDGDLDLLVGEEDDSQVLYLQNTGTASAPAFTQRTGTLNPFDALNPVASYRSQPTFVDIDNDGDFDAFIGDEGAGTVHFFRNTGTATSPAFTEVTGTSNPVNGFEAGTYSYVFPSFADIDNDGDYDLFIGGEGSVQYFENLGTASVANFGLFSKAVESYTQGEASLNVVDIDGDADKDVFVGTEYGSVLYYKNISSQAPNLNNQTGTANPLNGVNLSYWTNVASADLDNDGDKDLIVSGYYSDVVYYKNTGTATAPVFTQQTGTNSPIPTISNSAPIAELADIDNDGDFDMLIGFNNTMKFYVNSGTASAPVFTEVTGTFNPFAGVTGSYLAPALANVDADADLDLVVGTSTGDVFYFENTGTVTVPFLTARTGTSNPFNTSIVANTGSRVRPDFWDFDSDGDRDLFLGMRDGSILLYENNAVVTTGVTSGVAAKATLVEVFPNPTSGAFTVNVPAELSGSAVITITDLSGRELYSEQRELQSGELSYAQQLNNSQPGTYVLKIVMDNRVGVAKIVKY